MSAPGPESIPTSADPRSHRPTKKRALSPTSSQAASLSSLFAKPDQHIRIPDANKRSRVAAPPEIVTNVQGSSAGAGSGEFHVYKASRRREYERLRQMDDDLKREQEQESFEKERLEKNKKDDEKTRKIREKREKMKARKGKKGKPASSNGSQSQNGTGDTGVAVGTGDGANGAPTKSVKSSKISENGDSEHVGSSANYSGLVIHDDD